VPGLLRVPKHTSSGAKVVGVLAVTLWTPSPPLTPRLRSPWDPLPVPFGGVPLDLPHSSISAPATISCFLFPRSPPLPAFSGLTPPRDVSVFIFASLTLRFLLQFCPFFTAPPSPHLHPRFFSLLPTPFFDFFFLSRRSLTPPCPSPRYVTGVALPPPACPIWWLPFRTWLPLAVF